MSGNQTVLLNSSTPIQTCARIAGLLFLFTVIGGGVGEFYVPSMIVVANDAAATAHNVLVHASLFRIGFAAYLVEAICDIALTLYLYVLLKPAGRDLARLAVFFRLVSTSVFAVGELCYFAALPILSGAAYLKSFTPEQLNSLALLSLNLYTYCSGIFMVFYGAAGILFGVLMIRCGYLPKWLGALLALGGIGFVLSNFALVLARQYNSPFFALPMALAALALTGWLLIRGIDARRWEQVVGA